MAHRDDENRSTRDRGGSPDCLPRNLAALIQNGDRAGLGETLHRALCDFSFLHAYVSERGIGALLEDLDAVKAVEPSALKWTEEQRRGFSLLFHALELSKPVLVADPAQLASQLAGRFGKRTEPIPRSLLSGAEQNPRPWLKPESGALFQAGCPLSRSLHHLGSRIVALGVIEDKEQLLIGSSKVTGEGGYALLRIILPSSGRVVRSFDDERGEPSGDVTCLAPSPDGAHAVTGASSGRVRVWDLERGSSTGDASKRHRKPVSSVLFSEDGAHLFSASWDETIRVWDAHGKFMRELRGHCRGVNALVSTKGTLVSASYDSSIALWDVKGAINGNVEPFAYLGGQANHKSSVDCLTTALGGEAVVSASDDGALKIWQLSKGALLADWRLPLGFRATALTAAAVGSSEYLLAGDDHGLVWIWDLREWKSLGARRIHTFKVTALRALSTGALITAAEGEALTFWDLEALIVQAGEETPRAARPGISAAAGCAYLPVRQWQRRAMLSSSTGAYGLADSITLSSRHGGELREWRVTDHRVSAVAATPDGRTLYTSETSRDCGDTGPFGIAKWDLNTLDESGPPRGAPLSSAHQSGINALAVSRDGRRLLSVGEDRTAVLWDIETDEPIARFTAEGPLIACSLDETGDGAVVVDAAGRTHTLKRMPAFR